MNLSITLKKLGYLLSLFALVALVSCGGKSEDDEDMDDLEDDESGEVAGGAAQTPDMANGATITGTVVMEGAAPANKTIDMGGDAACKAAHSTPVTADAWVAGEGGALKNAFVYLKDVKGEWTVPAAVVTLDQKGCEYEPHVFGIQVGQTLKIMNSDPTLHNVHAKPAANAEFNKGQPKGAGAIEHKMEKAEVMVPFNCDVHRWMSSYGGVLSHPFYAVTGPDGKFSIAGVPPGTYTVEVWHEVANGDRAGVTANQSVTVAAKESKAVDFKLAAK